VRETRHADGSFALEFRNDAAALVSVRDRVRDELAARGVDESAAYAVDLVLEELAGNALRYGYRELAEGSMRVDVSVEARCVRVVIEDDARPFDPTHHPEPAPAKQLRDAPIGGRGISMVRRVVSAMRYERREGHNVLEVEVPRASA
jgi:serine/threonine-protein kinase RsbW